MNAVFGDVGYRALCTNPQGRTSELSQRAVADAQAPDIRVGARLP